MPVYHFTLTLDVMLHSLQRVWCLYVLLSGTLLLACESALMTCIWRTEQACLKSAYALGLLLC